ncbi:tyrosine--tRNA ligase [Candidatus Geothermarchaeota archaeon]|nr:MAG: tyrosine--tRNA ligase [Candidatus Geothermarchaeota archaeon]
MAYVSIMNLEERLKLIKRGTQEIITEAELKQLIEEKKSPKAYWGFECSGLMHIGMGLVVGYKIRDLIKAGLRFYIFLADWHSWINNKLGGDMNKIRLAGEYFKEGFKALGIKGENVKYIWSSELVKSPKYWETVIKIAKKTTLNRAIRTLPIMGRKETSKISEVAWLIYPLMQAADIFELGVDIACAGIDQRKVHMLAREVAKSLDRKKPVLIHTPLLPSLNVPVPRSTAEVIDVKMSKSKGEAIYIHDPPEEIRRKVIASYCPPKNVDENPIFYLLKLVIFPHFGKLKVEREAKYGGDITYESYDDIVSDYLNGQLHPADLKEAIARKLIDILAPVRAHFKRKSEMLELMVRFDEEQKKIIK